MIFGRGVYRSTVHKVAVNSHRVFHIYCDKTWPGVEYYALWGRMDLTESGSKGHEPDAFNHGQC